MEQLPLLALELVLQHFDSAADVASLRLSCRAWAELFPPSFIEELFRRFSLRLLSHSHRSPAMLRCGPRKMCQHYYLTRRALMSTESDMIFVNWEREESSTLWNVSANRSALSSVASFSTHQCCASRNGARYVIFTDENASAPAMVVLDRILKKETRFPWIGHLVWAHWDASNTVAFLICVSAVSMMLYAIDVETGVVQVLLEGAPLFWSNCHAQPGLILFHGRRRLAWIDALAPVKEERVQKLPMDVSDDFQCPVALADRRFIFVGPDSKVLMGSPDGKDLECLCSVPASARLVMLQITWDEAFLIHGHNEQTSYFLSDLTVLNLQTRKAWPVSETQAVAVFPANRFVLFLSARRDLQEQSHVMFVFLCFDTVTGKTAESSHFNISRSVMNNRVPFNSAYAQSHSPWHRDGLRFCYLVDNQIWIQSVVNVDDHGFRLSPPVALPCASDSHDDSPVFAWFAS